MNAFGAVHRATARPTGSIPREAIVIYGQMPPPGRYMGLQTWESSQPGHWKAKDYDTWARDPTTLPHEPPVQHDAAPNPRRSGLSSQRSATTSTTWSWRASPATRSARTGTSSSLPARPRTTPSAEPCKPKGCLTDTSSPSRSRAGIRPVRSGRSGWARTRSTSTRSFATPSLPPRTPEPHGEANCR